MDYVSIISSVGFPIFACCALAWYCYDSNKRNNEKIDQLRAVIIDNTKVIQALIDKLDV